MRWLVAVLTMTACTTQQRPVDAPVNREPIEGAPAWVEGLALREAARVLVANQRRLEACFEDPQLRHNVQGGDLLLAFHVTESGTVEAARVTASTLPDEPRFVACVIEIANAFALDSRPGATDVVLPIHLPSEEERKHLQRAPAVMGSLALEDAEAVIRQAQAPIETCRKAAQGRGHPTRGVVKLKFVISNEGLVTHVLIQDSSVQDPALAMCVADTIRPLTFPRPRGGGVAIVIHPFTFSDPTP